MNEKVKEGNEFTILSKHIRQRLKWFGIKSFGMANKTLLTKAQQPTRFLVD
jgi:hypothetical protein